MRNTKNTKSTQVPDTYRNCRYFFYLSYMNLRFCVFTCGFLFFSLCLFAQNKVPLDHSVYDSWKSLANPIISNNGQWVSYEINPAKGDGWLFIENLETGYKDSISRGYDAQFHDGSQFIVFKLKPPHDTIRELKIQDVKPEKWPKDSVAVIRLTDNFLYKSGEAESYKLGEKGGEFVAIHLNKDEPEEETEKEKKKREKKGLPLITPEGGNLLVYYPLTGTERIFESVGEYAISKNGSWIVFTETTTVDTLNHVVLKNYGGDGEPQNSITLLEDDGWMKQLTLDEEGVQVGFLMTTDTAEKKLYNLWWMAWDCSNSDSEAPGVSATLVADSNHQSFQSGWAVSEYGNMFFSKDATRLYFNSAPVPINSPKDTLPKDEIAVLDVWNWRDSRLQPQQIHELEEDQKKSYRCVYHIDSRQIIQLGTEEIDDVAILDDGNSNWALGMSDIPYEWQSSWGGWYNDIYLINVRTGEQTLVTKKAQFGAELSPNMPRVAYYNYNDSTWYCYDHETGTTHNLTSSIKYAFYNEKHDTPSEPNPYGFTGWTVEGQPIVNDRFDLWVFTITDSVSSHCATDERGRNSNTRYTLQEIKLKEETPFVNLDLMLLRGVNELTKSESFVGVGTGSFQLMYEKDMRLTFVTNAPEKPIFMFRQQSFTEYPNLHVTMGGSFDNTKKLTDVNSQQNNFLWGTAELTSWTTPMGREMNGIIYKPEDFDSTLKYPMIVYFYENYTDDFYRHYSAYPSWSWINFPYYTSNGYVVFVPDIEYSTGHPGQDAMDCVTSGTVHMAANDWIDETRIAIDGQSWGGYQVAYIVTQTDLYAAAMAGAPVSNMTSAYGGIRWGSGLSRMFQYERTQSRLGATLWDSLNLYIENSPVFFADEVTTPLLIMHNDGDGAVPWYQGIEYFVALRRLRKPVWMLNYNGDEHNLRQWANRKDLTIRMSQFFNHYLKGAPAPEWMIEGVPAMDKGIDYGLDLMEED